jgi:hypothetical protein
VRLAEEGVQRGEPAHARAEHARRLALGARAELGVHHRLERVEQEVDVQVGRAAAADALVEPGGVLVEPRAAQVRHADDDALEADARAVCMARSTRHAPLKLSSGSNRFWPSCMYSTGQRVPRASGAMYDGGR